MRDLTPSEARRKEMVLRQIAARGVSSERVLTAMEKVPRHLFVPQTEQPYAYTDRPLPIGHRQTISQPYIVAYMAEALDCKPGDSVLEIGTGSGYAAAVLAEIGADVISIERIPSLADQAKDNLATAGYTNVQVQCADGCLGLPSQAPFDGIIVTAGAPVAPDRLKKQLKTGGRLVVPVGEQLCYQKLQRITRTGEETFRTENLCDVAFVPLVGEQAWHSDEI
ncbi:protein-L-isoaspartate(D-aspartate) O-methyltransferase [Roseibium sp. RKSG952]|uniref:protein-L-isoaspartate(D-aspartate) O-methyltransferase n=1 Tax=Roseibium sp. RKSG952 TaxID=2529384 RepID=UPI0012BCCBBE|nr:protein-L-isoaspartate(D-aspartate) O-methyltransferase [Roseibium sp. RKSG952]MTH96824.1 protein-L-isoaspartate(D-aspartate) O-methyltransferase [Roseibium sp. RKSG952]